MLNFWENNCEGERPMKVLFISTTCARSDYEEICKRRKIPMLDSSQKFFEMFLGGLAQMEDILVECITVPPISRGTYPGNYIRAHVTRVGNLTYHYTPIWNFPVLKSLFATRSVKKIMRRLIKEAKDDSIKIICDPLLLEGLKPSVTLGKEYGILTVGFLTDMPIFADECDGHRGIKAIMYRTYNRSIERYMGKLDRYIVLTKAMQCVADGKPWMLLDCIVDETMLSGLEPLIHDDCLPHIVYAGKLHREFGLDLLGEAMTLVKCKCIFDLYGDGNYIQELKKLATLQKNIRLHGVVPLKEVLRAELSSTVLVNPRTSKGEFTKYSFPSKTAEYMLAGKPVVMFKLPGISNEYASYVHFAKEETALALADEIDKILAMTECERKAIGDRAKEYVIRKKNNISRAESVIRFITAKVKL